ncbi:relaxase/mobilization nuclease domain-containing protein [Desulfobulbus elongatus]|uniref:relaxase/mobilization nuclease domain-containing protein n=1 Tax=Desulfobulbus elongatus TaxID=53332 RepID=UPI0009FEC5E5|nr:relaxase/mobilization nuclease domain-containing protein [Desulfobulbus elongatus]
MIIKAFPHGKGGGHGPVNYVTSDHYQGRDELPPTVLRGDPEITKNLIDDVGKQGRAWKFSAGVLSWHPDDEVSLRQEQDVMDAFEQVAFAGLEADAYNILWVRHEHANHHELHFVIPRMELNTGKAFNALPPGWQKEFDVLRDLFNEREQWARPDDPARARTRQPGNTGLINARRKRVGLPEKEDPREAVHAYVEERIAQGFIQNRVDVLQSLQEIGLEINRSGKNYITFILPENGKKYRLKGGVYDESWSIEQTAAIQNGTGQERTGTSITARIRDLEQELERIITKRSAYNRTRYATEKPRDLSKMRRDPQRDRTQIAGLGQKPRKSMVSQLSDRDRDRGWIGSGNNGDIPIAQQPLAQPAIRAHSTQRRQNESRTKPRHASTKDLGHLLHGKPTGQILGTQHLKNLNSRLGCGQSTSLESGVSHDRTRTPSHRQSGKTGNRPDRQAGCDNIRDIGPGKSHSRLRAACALIGAALQRVGQHLATIERQHPSKTRESKSTDLSR